MKSVPKPVKSLVNAAVLAVLANTSVHAGGFSLYTEGAASAVGNYAAGIAAEAADASTGWYNPAGLALLHNQQAVLAGVGVFPTAEINGTSTYFTNGFPSFSQTFTGLDGGKEALVPSFHYARPIGENATFGLSLVSPFGLSTDWGRSPVRYSATFSELITANISPELGARVTDHLSIGAGLDLQYARVKFNRVIGSPAALQAIELPPNLFDSLSYNQGNSFGVGFHAGILTLFNGDHTRIGLNYQSKMKHKFHGYSRLSGILADPLVVNANSTFRTNNLFSNNVEFPEIVTLSGYHDVNDKLALLASVVYTGWDSFNYIQLNNVAAFNLALGNVAVQTSSIQDYNNAWRFAVGSNYHLNEHLMLRGGVGYDQTPTTDLNRDVRLPDGNRWALSIGARYDVTPALAVDLGYTYLFSAGDPVVNKTEAIGATSAFRVYACGNAHASLFGLGVVWHIDQEPVAVTK